MITSGLSSAFSVPEQTVAAPRRRAGNPTDAGASQVALMDRLIDLLIEKAKAGLHWPELYNRAEAVLGQMILPGRSARLVNKRVRNAHAYAAVGDFGAAAFELRLVRTQIGLL